MINITTHFKAPLLALNIQNSIKSIDNTDNYIFAIQLHYREAHTQYSLEKIESINFDENFLEIKHTNGSCNYFNYNDISEYHIINANDLTDLWGDEI